MRSTCRLLWTALAFAALFGFVVGSPAPADDVVIMNDGYSFRGVLTRERSPVNLDKFPRKAFFDAVGVGPKYIFFSGHAKKQLAAIDKGVEKPPVVAYARKPPRLGSQPPPGVGILEAGDWKDSWTRTLKVKYSGGRYENIDQMISYLGPDAMYVVSTSHQWGQSYDTREFPPEHIRKLLSMHPELKDPPGEVDPIRRLKIATFMKDVGWHVSARQEIDKLKKDMKAALNKEAQERQDQLLAELDTAETKRVIEDLEAAVASGRYKLAAAVLPRYEPKSSDAKDLTKLAELRATVEKVGPQYELTARLLRELIDRATGVAAVNARGAALGGFVVPSTPRPKLAGDAATLVTAASAVLAELHPDTATRLESFRMAADGDDRAVKAGREPANKPEVLFALAVNGWLRGKNGAIPLVEKAVKTWHTRETALAYLRERIGNERAGILKTYLASTNRLAPEELAQIVSLLPPVTPEPLDAMGGRKIPAKDAHNLENLFLRNTGPLPSNAAGEDYYLRLPDEYHHGRSYPLVVAVTDPGMPPETMLASIAEMANKHGYIVAAPKWTVGFVPPYDYTGKEHPMILTVMRDVGRRFQVDPDKVFLFGLGTGGTLALDLGLAHPDLFAGLTLFGPTPIHQALQHVWTNAQKLPIFTVTGDRSGLSCDSMRHLNESWLPNGYPSLFTVYRGRGAEWFQTEVPNAFDWMNRKVRARGIASLRLNDKRFDSWKSMRSTDNRFYWVGFEDMHPRHEFKTPARPDLAPLPATFRADIRAGNKIVVDQIVGVKKLAIWLERDMIDWEKPVEFAVDGGLSVPRKGKIEPDLQLMFEELYRTGDKKMLFFGKVEIKTSG